MCRILCHSCNCSSLHLTRRRCKRQPLLLVFIEDHNKEYERSSQECARCYDLFRTLLARDFPLLNMKCQDSWRVVRSLVLTVVDEMCFFSISAQRQTSGLTACAEYPFARVCHAAKFRRRGRRSPSTATPRGRPPQARNDHDPTHTAEGPPQARQAAAYPIRCSFHLLPILVYRNPSKRPAVAKYRDTARQAAADTDHGRAAPGQASYSLTNLQFPLAVNSGLPVGRLCGGHICRQRSDVTLLGWRGHNGCERHDTSSIQSISTPRVISPNLFALTFQDTKKKQLIVGRRCAGPEHNRFHLVQLAHRHSRRVAEVVSAFEKSLNAVIWHGLV